MESKMGWVGKTTKFNTKLNISVNYFQAKINTIVSMCQRSLTYDRNPQLFQSLSRPSRAGNFP